jgi:GH15 family glucan-1,4-alpha-glucosidase
MGRQNEARQMFEALLTLRNDTGLLSEEYDPVKRRMLGNFPQTLTHVTMILSALNLEAEHEPMKVMRGEG